MIHITEKKAIKDEICFFAILVILAIILYRKFIFGDCLYMYLDAMDDTFQSYLPTYQVVINSIISKSESFYSMICGFGENLLTGQMIIFEPLAIIVYGVGLLFGVKKIAYALVFVQIVRVILAGLSCRFLLSQCDINVSVQRVVSIVFAFSAYVVGDIGQHYQFCAALIFATIGVGIVLKAYRSQCKCNIVISYVAVICIWSAYFSYMILVTCGLFWLLLLASDNSDFSQKGKRTLQVFSSVIVGMAVSAILFLPSVFQYICATDRITGNSSSIWNRIIKSFSMFSKQEYKSFFLRLFSNQIQGDVNNWGGAKTSFNTEHVFLCSILIFALVEYFHHTIHNIRNRKERIALISLLVCSFLSLSKFLGFGYNAFVEYSNRYLFVLFPAFAYILAWYLNDIFIKKNMDIYRVIRSGIICVVSVTIICLCAKWDSSTGKFCATGAIVSISIFIICIMTVRYETKKIFWYFCAIGIVLHNIFDANVSLYIGRNAVSKGWYQNYGLNGAIEKAKEDWTLNCDAFYRTERVFYDYGVQPASCYSRTSWYRGVSFYNSVISPKLTRFQNNALDICYPMNIRACYSMGDLGLPMDPELADIYGIKYVVSDYVNDDCDWNLLGEYDEKYLYVNPDLRCAGLLYHSIISNDIFEKFSPLQKRAALANAVVVEDSVDETYEVYSDTEIEYHDLLIQLGEDAKESLALMCEGTKEIEFDITNDSSGNCQRAIDISVDGSVGSSIDVWCDIGNGFYERNWINSFSIDASGSKMIECLIPCNTKRIRIAMHSKGKLVVENVLCAEISGISYSNDGIELINHSNGGTIIGEVSTEENAILLLPLIFSDGWTVSLDGVSAKMFPVDYAFTGIELSSGTHNLVFEYHTPWLKEGIIISIVGIIIWLVVNIWSWYHRERTKGKVN